MKNKILLFKGMLVFAFFLLSACAHQQIAQSIDPACLEKRAAFDIGSGTTKVKLAEVDICKNTVLKIILDQSIAIPFQEDLLASGKKKLLSPQIMELGRIEFAQLLDVVKSNGATSVGGVATQAFREAKNGRKYVLGLEEIANQYLPSQILVVSQDLEARIGFEAGIAAANSPAIDTIVWDIGGGSQQMSASDLMQPKRLIAYKGHMASTNFMKSFKQNINSKGKSTPNPIGLKQFQSGIETARNSAKQTVPTALRDRVHTEKKVIGIGGVLSKSVAEQVGMQTFSTSDIESVAKQRLSLTDEQIGGDYASTQVSNLILVLGYMRELGIQEVRSVDANLATGVLLTKEFWRQR